MTDPKPMTEERLAEIEAFAMDNEGGYIAWRTMHKVAAKALVAEVRTLRAELAELNALFDLQHARSLEADNKWRAAHPGKENATPDLGELLSWLLSELAKRDACAMHAAAEMESFTV